MQVADAKRLIELLGATMDEADCEAFIGTFNRHLEVRTVNADRSVYEEMVGSGAFSRIEEQRLKSQIASYYQLAEHFEIVIRLHVSDFRHFSNRVSMDGTVARSYFDSGTSLSSQERCSYLNSLASSKEDRRILENFFYLGIDTYEQISTLYSFLLRRYMTGLSSPAPGDVTPSAPRPSQ